MIPIDVLLIDDEPGILEVLFDICQLKGYETKTANNGIEALKILESYIPALILSDISMPGMNGLELIEKVKIRGYSSAMVMLTAHSQSPYLIKALQLGCLDYLTKPFDASKLMDKFDAWIEVGRRLQAVQQGDAVNKEDLTRQLRMIELFRLKNASNKAKADE